MLDQSPLSVELAIVLLLLVLEGLGLLLVTALMVVEEMGLALVTFTFGGFVWVTLTFNVVAVVVVVVVVSPPPEDSC